MAFYCIRSCINAAGDMTGILFSRWQCGAGNLHHSQLQLPFTSKLFFRSSNINTSRWPKKRDFINLSDNHLQDNFVLSRLWKPFGFTIIVSAVSFGGAAIWQYENVRSQATHARRWWGSSHTPKYGEFRQRIHRWWHGLSVADRTFVPICAINLLVFLAWKVPKYEAFMSRYFVSGLAQRAVCLPMLLSMFSHFSVLHLAANMFVLHSFTEKAVSSLGREQFVAVYLSSGVFSFFTSLLFKAVTKSPSSSLGASGAVMCMLAYVCAKYPESKLAIILLPQFPFDAGSGLKALICMDTLGCIFRWTFFDHAAHLGGSLFGVMWYKWGSDHIWKKREPLLSVWHRLRGPVQ